MTLRQFTLYGWRFVDRNGKASQYWSFNDSRVPIPPPGYEFDTLTDLITHLTALNEELTR